MRAKKPNGLSLWLPLALRPADLDAAPEGPVDVAEMADELLLQSPDVVGDPVEADAVALAPRQWRKWPRISANPLTQLPNAMKARHRPMQVDSSNSRDRRIDHTRDRRDTGAGGASGAQEPRTPLHIPINRNPVPVDRNIDRLCGEPV